MKFLFLFRDRSLITGKGGGGYETLVGAKSSFTPTKKGWRKF